MRSELIGKRARISRPDGPHVVVRCEGVITDIVAGYYFIKVDRKVAEGPVNSRRLPVGKMEIETALLRQLEVL